MIWIPALDGAGFVSDCHADGVWGASAAAGSERLRWGMGLSRGSDCALAKSIQVSNQTNEIVSSVRAQIFLRFMLAPSCRFLVFVNKRVGGLLTGGQKTLENVSSPFDGLH